MTMFKTKYPNNTRVVTATPQLFNDDVILVCDTTTAPVIINLLDIAPEFWSTQWRLYIVDSGNSSVNNITINAGAGQLINGQNSLIVNVDNATCIIKISSDNTFLGELTNNVSPIFSLEILNDGDSLTTTPSSLNFANGLQATTPSPGDTDVTVSLADSNWLNLEGFDFLDGYANRPQCRLIGKQLHFRGTVIIPLATTNAGTTLVPIQLSPPIGSFYANDPLPFVYQGIGGVTLSTAGGLLFNKNNSILPEALSQIQIDNLYNQGPKIAVRPVATSNANSGTSLSSVVSISITNTARLVVSVYKDFESSPNIPNASIGIGTGGLRQIVSNVKTGQAVVDFRDAGGGSVANSNAGASPFNRDFLTPDLSNTFLFDVDAGEENQVGGFQFRLDGLSAFTV